MTPPNSTVILGAGIIGCSTAYYLSQSMPGSSIHLVDSSPELFASASGKAGGFLAADWFGPSVAPLGALSFKLHKDLAKDFDGHNKWGYTTSTGASFTASQAPISSNGKKVRGDDWLREGQSRAEVAGEHEFVDGDGPAWLTRRKGDSYEVIGENDTVAQVDPLRLCHFLRSECKARGVQIHQPATATAITKDDQNRLSGIKLRFDNGQEIELPCTHLLLSAGAWTPRIFSTLFPSSSQRIPISSLAGHSLVLRSPRWSPSHESKGCHAVFTTSSEGFSPELISRVGGEIYVAGLNDAGLALPDRATDARIDRRSIEILKREGQRLCALEGTKGEDLEVVREGLCFRPVTGRGTPILGRIGEGKLGKGVGVREGGGVWVAAGHGPWGISLSLGTGLVMSEMMLGRKTSAKVSGLAL